MSLLKPSGISLIFNKLLILEIFSLSDLISSKAFAAAFFAYS